ncbi:MAG: adenylate kinase [Methanobacteriaceae archaeon]
MKLIVITGIPGSGSTTVLSKALEEVEYTHLNYGDIMTKIAVSEGLVENRDQLRKLSPETQKKVQKLAAKEIKNRSKLENVIVDTHCTISTPSGFLPGLPNWVLEELQPNGFIMIEAKASEIIARRAGDELRVRDIEGEDEIDLHQEMNRAVSMAYATLTGATVKILKNYDNQLDETIAKMVTVLKM